MSIIANTYLNFVTFSYQQTPLHVAASKGRDYTVECLVEKGADMNIKDKNGASVKQYFWSYFCSADLSFEYKTVNLIILLYIPSSCTMG